MGGIVINNPRGSKFGTIEITLTEAANKDALFGNLPEKVPVHTGHKQSVVELPTGSKILASSERDPHTAFFILPSTWEHNFIPSIKKLLFQVILKKQLKRSELKGRIRITYKEK